MKLPLVLLRRVVAAALDEDLGTVGDRTTDLVIPGPVRGRARIVARESLVLAGLDVAEEVFRSLSPALAFERRCRDGRRVDAGSDVAVVTGDARPILRGERTALNFLMRMSGVATAAAEAVAEVQGTGARILDTRKTVPGLRALDKYAVAAGGAQNHRMGLHDAVMIKDTHLEVIDSIEDGVARALAGGMSPDRVTVEVRSVAQLHRAVASGAGRALLDNMSLHEMREAVTAASGAIELEASGGLRPGKLRAVAETGVDCLSLGYLTHSARAADLAMEMDWLPAGGTPE
jgi:nicotinate-nucleotide pyrophosphorylase (carboxylating)